MDGKRDELILMTKKQEARVRREIIQKIKKASNADLFDLGCTLRIIDISDAWERSLQEGVESIKFISDNEDEQLRNIKESDAVFNA